MAASALSYAPRSTIAPYAAIAIHVAGRDATTAPTTAALATVASASWSSLQAHPDAIVHADRHGGLFQGSSSATLQGAFSTAVSRSETRRHHFERSGRKCHCKCSYRHAERGNCAVGCRGA